MPSERDRLFSKHDFPDNPQYVIVTKIRSTVLAQRKEIAWPEHCFIQDLHTQHPTCFPQNLQNEDFVYNLYLKDVKNKTDFTKRRPEKDLYTAILQRAERNETYKRICY